MFSILGFSRYRSSLAVCSFSFVSLMFAFFMCFVFSGHVLSRSSRFSHSWSLLFCPVLSCHLSCRFGSFLAAFGPLHRTIVWLPMDAVSRQDFRSLYHFISTCFHAREPQLLAKILSYPEQLCSLGLFCMRSAAKSLPTAWFWLYIYINNRICKQMTQQNTWCLLKLLVLTCLLWTLYSVHSSLPAYPSFSLTIQCCGFLLWGWRDSTYVDGTCSKYSPEN